ncbi:MAG: pilus assembly protein CpaF, partial [Chloroflexota bacterium]|nr:pilus assembly protein CpaF [Chloroflexota bacterium]
MKITVRFVDGEELEGESSAVTLQKLGFEVNIASGGNTRTVWVSMAAIKYLTIQNEGVAATPVRSIGDPRANLGLPKVVVHFLDGEVLHSYRDEEMEEQDEGFRLRIWNPKSRTLETVLVSAHALKGIFMVDDWDSRSEDERREDATRLRAVPDTSVPMAWTDPDIVEQLDPEMRRLAYNYQRRLALERDLELTGSDLLSFERAIRMRLDRLLEDDLVALQPHQKHQLVTYILRESVGYGPIDPLLKDPTITEVMVNAPDEIYIERNGQILRSQVRFDDNSQLMNVIRRMAASIGRRVDETSPMVDARLPDGSRLNAVIPPAATRGPALTIRKFRAFKMGLEDLVGEGTLSPAMAAFLQAAVRGRLNLVISGGTGSGKTTTMNVLGALIPVGERVVTIEDSAELNLAHPHVVSLEYRPANVEGTGELTIRQLLRNSLRMRPDRVMVGEVRDAAALDMLQAMNTGHDGSMSTIHANSARDAFSRLETMVLASGVEIPLPAVRAQVASAIDVVVQQARLPDGSRKIVQIAEMSGYEGETPILNDIFLYHRSHGGENIFEPTGVVPANVAKLAFYGVELAPEVFASDPWIAPARPTREGEPPPPLPGPVDEIPLAPDAEFAAAVEPAATAEQVPAEQPGWAPAEMPAIPD